MHGICPDALFSYDVSFESGGKAVDTGDPIPGIDLTRRKRSQAKKEHSSSEETAKDKRRMSIGRAKDKRRNS
ncbi:MAG: hypothetical protein ACE5QF_05990 [Thermoplasmata archaeon]